jgi:hypothetical protein
VGTLKKVLRDTIEVEEMEREKEKEKVEERRKERQASLGSPTLGLNSGAGNVEKKVEWEEARERVEKSEESLLGNLLIVVGGAAFAGLMYYWYKKN